jgi:hypothetical protein
MKMPASDKSPFVYSMDYRFRANAHILRSGRMSSVVMLAVLAGSLGAQTVSGPALSPVPREVRAGAGVPVHAALVTVPGGAMEDLFAAGDLEASLKADGLTVAPAAGPVDLTVKLLRADSSEAKTLLAAERLSFQPAMHEEGYVLVARAHEATVIGETAAGLFYGVQTLKQLVERAGGGATLWTGTIRDWPAMKYRGVHDDLSRGPFPTLAFQEHQLEVFAAHKVNVYSPYLEHTLQYSGQPLAAPPGSALTRAEAQELVAYATRLHILVVPEQEAFGHLHHVLQYEKYSDLAETPHGHVLAPGQAGSLPLIDSWFTQIAQDFPGPFLHIGADETFELGTGRTKADVDKRGLGPVYADFLRSIHTELKPLGRRLLFWGDVAWSDPSAIAGLPKDMVAIPWIYWHEDSYDGNIVPFKTAGIETWVAPGDANWKVVYPLGAAALDNISGFIESGQRLGSTGELTTVWDDDGEGLFNEDWFGVLFGAAAGWQPAQRDLKVEPAAYVATFGRTFYGDPSGRIDEAQKELMSAEQGPDEIDVADQAFFMDPFTPAGAAWAKKFLPHVPAARRHAERAIELIEFVKADTPGLKERDALDAMELGARRIDFIGMKAQLADEMASAYAKAYTLKDDKNHETETRELLYSISAMNGRCQDLRDAYSMLKNLYKASWLAENRPYWLDNVLVRYDLEIERWQRRGDAVNTLIDTWQATKALPPAGAAGLPDSAL